MKSNTKAATTQLWALAVVAMFVCCAFTTCVAADWSSADPEETGPSGTEEETAGSGMYYLLSQFMSEEQIEMMLELFGEYFPVELDVYLPMISLMLDSVIKLNPGVLEEPGVKIIDDKGGKISEGDEILVLKDGARLTLTENTFVPSIIVAGKDVTITSTEGSTLSFNSLSFPMFPLFQEYTIDGEAMPFVVTFDSDSSLVFDYEAVNSLTITEDGGDVVPSEDMKVSLKASMGVTGTKVSLRQDNGSHEYIVSEDYYSSKDIDKRYDDIVFSANGAKNLDISLDLDVSTFYGDLDGVFEDATALEIPFRVISAYRDNELHMPDVSLNVALDSISTRNYDGYSYEFTSKEKEEYGCSQNTNVNDYSYSGISLGFKSDSKTNSCNLVASVGKLEYDYHYNFESQNGDSDRTVNNDSHTTVISDVKVDFSVQAGLVKGSLDIGEFRMEDEDDRGRTIDESVQSATGLHLAGEFKTENVLDFICDDVPEIFAVFTTGDEDFDTAEFIAGLDLSKLFLGATVVFDIGGVSSHDYSKFFPDYSSPEYTVTEKNMNVENVHLKLVANTDTTVNAVFSLGKIDLLDTVGSSDGKKELSIDKDLEGTVSDVSVEVAVNLADFFDISKGLLYLLFFSYSEDAGGDGMTYPSYHTLAASAESDETDSDFPFDFDLFVKLLRDDNVRFEVTVGYLSISQLREEYDESMTTIDLVDFALGVSVDTSSKASVDFRLGDLTMKNEIKEMDGTVVMFDNVTDLNLHSIDFHFKANASRLADVLTMLVSDVDSVKDSQFQLQVIALLLNESGVSVDISVGFLSFEKNDEYRGYRDVAKLTLAAPANAPAFSFKAEFKAGVDTKGLVFNFNAKGGFSDGAELTIANAHSPVAVTSASAAAPSGDSHYNGVEVSGVSLDSDITAVIAYSDLIAGNIDPSVIEKFHLSGVFDFKTYNVDLTGSDGLLSMVSATGVKMEIPTLAVSDPEEYITSIDTFTASSVKAPGVTADIESVVANTELLEGTDARSYSASVLSPVKNDNGSIAFLVNAFSVNGERVVNTEEQQYLGILTLTDDGYILDKEDESATGPALYLAAVTIVPEVDKDGNANLVIEGASSAEVSDEKVTAAIAAAGDKEVRFKFDTEDKTNMELSLSKTSVESLVESGKPMIVVSPAGSISLDVSVQQTIASKTGDDVVLKLKALDSEEIAVLIDPALREKVGNAPVVSIDLSVAGASIHELDGTATITIPYVKSSGSVVVYYLNQETNTLEKIEGATYNENDKTVTFNTTHFSMYSIDEVPNDGGNGGDDLILYIAIGAVVVVLVLAGVVVFLRSKAGKTN